MTKAEELKSRALSMLELVDNKSILARFYQGMLYVLWELEEHNDPPLRENIL